MNPPTVSRRFPPAKRRMIVGWLDTVLRAVRDCADEAGLVIENWPRSIAPMTAKEIRQDEKVGGGHGVYLRDGERIRLNASMPWLGLITNLIHELWHHVDWCADEDYINEKVVPYVYELATAEHLDAGDWEKFRGHKRRSR